MKHRLSASKYHLAVAGCTYWARPDVVWPADKPGSAAMLGTAVHALVEADIRRRMGEQYEAGVDDMEAPQIARQATRFLDGMPVPTAVELALVYDAGSDSSRRGGRGRDYGAVGVLEMPSTLDLVWHMPNEVWVIDLKTGSKTHAHEEQLAIQALAAARFYGVPRARVGFLFARKTKCDPPEWRDLSAEDIDAEMWRVSSLLRALPASEPLAGDHCFYCPMGPRKGKPGTCPAYTDSAASAAETEMGA